MTARTLNAHGVALGREAFERQHRKHTFLRPRIGAPDASSRRSGANGGDNPA